MGQYIHGILYDPEGNKIYDGEFINNLPKKCKNINLYEIDGNLKFVGNISEGKYQGKGNLYKDNKLLYEGNFKDGLYEGNGVLYVDENNKYEGFFKEGKYNSFGKLYKDNYLCFEGEFIEGKKNGHGIFYYPNKQKYFEGNFEKNEIKGEGIKYYDNSAKKIEAFYINTLQCKGKYYSPDNELLYDGDMQDEIPCNKESIKIYNDYTYKIYKLEKINDIYNSINFEYYPNFFSSEKLKNKFNFKIPVVSFYTFTGKTALLHRLTYGAFKDIKFGTIGLDFFKLIFEKNNKKYKGIFYDLNGHFRTRPLNKWNIINSNFVIFTINVFSEDEIDEDYINEIKDYIAKESIIYLVGNKLEDRFNISNLEKNRNKVQELMKKNKINKYFEVDAKTGEGVEILLGNIKFDILAFCKNLEKDD